MHDANVMWKECGALFARAEIFGHIRKQLQSIADNDLHCHDSFLALIGRVEAKIQQEALDAQRKAVDYVLLCAGLQYNY
jgi:hypothetical protein